MLSWMVFSRVQLTLRIPYVFAEHGSRWMDELWHLILWHMVLNPHVWSSPWLKVENPKWQQTGVNPLACHSERTRSWAKKRPSILLDSSTLQLKSTERWAQGLIVIEIFPGDCPISPVPSERIWFRREEPQRDLSFFNSVPIKWTSDTMINVLSIDLLVSCVFPPEAFVLAPNIRFSLMIFWLHSHQANCCR